MHFVIGKLFFLDGTERTESDVQKNGNDCTSFFADTIEQISNSVLWRK